MYPDIPALFWSVVGTVVLDEIDSAVDNSTVVVAVVLWGAPSVIRVINI